MMKEASQVTDMESLQHKQPLSLTNLSSEKHNAMFDGKRLHDDGTSDEAASSHNSVQAGVKGIEAISKVWTTKSLILAYVGIFLMAFVTSLDGQVIGASLPFVTSSFQQHSLLSTISVVQSVVQAVGKPPMAKIADVFGRIEAFIISIILYTVGYIVMATSNGVRTFAAAQIFYALGSTGLLVLQQIFIADTTDLSWRAMMSTLPDVPYLITTWIGTLIAEDIRNQTGSWRWAIAMWAIILPAAFLPLLFSLIVNGRRAKKVGVASPKQHISRKGDWSGGRRAAIKTLARRSSATVWQLWKELDAGGLLILAAGFSLILITCTIAQSASGGWSNPSMIAMVVVGAFFIVLYPFWETSSYVANKYDVRGRWGRVLRELAPYPFTPLHLLKSRTFSAGCILVTFYFMAFNLSVFPYFYSYLLVVRNLPPTSAVYITQIFSFSATVGSLVASLLIKLTQRYKWFTLFGACLYTLGMGLMIHYRHEDSTVSSIIGAQICIGFGGGFLVVPAQLGVQASAGHQNVGAATAVFLTLLSIGSAIGQAISGAVWSRNIPRKLAAYLPPSAQPNASLIFGSIVTAMSYPVGSPERDAINRSYQETMRLLVTIAACTCAPILVCAVVMRNYHLDEIEQGVKGRIVGGTVGDNRLRQSQLHGNVYSPKTWLRNFNAWRADQREAAVPRDRAVETVA